MELKNDSTSLRKKKTRGFIVQIFFLRLKIYVHALFLLATISFAYILQSPEEWLIRQCFKHFRNWL